MMGDELLPKRSPDKNRGLVMIKGIYHIEYSVRSSLGKLKRFHQRATLTLPFADAQNTLLNRFTKLIKAFLRSSFYFFVF